MKSLYLLLAVAAVFTATVQGAGTEPYHPLLSEGKMWVTNWGKYSYQSDCYDVLGKNAIKIGEQVFFGETSYYEILSSNDWPDFPEGTWKKSSYSYVREEGRKVYHYINHSGCEKEELLYDFDLPLDTTVFLGILYEYPFCGEGYKEIEELVDSLCYKYKVTAIDSVNTEQGRRKRILFNLNRWIEGVGDVSEGLFYRSQCRFDGIIVHLEACYEDGELIYRAGESSWECIGAENVPITRLRAYIQENMVVIEGLPPGEEITVYAPSGVLLQTLMSTGDRVEISLPSKGIYLIKAAGETVKVIY